MLGTLKGKPALYASAAFVLLVLFFIGLSNKEYVPSFTKATSASLPVSDAWSFVPERDERNLGLSNDQCDVSRFITRR